MTSHNIALRTAEVVNIHEVYGKTAGVIHDCDVVMVLKDNTVVSGLDALVKLCNAHHKLLFTTDLDSCDRGAALSFGVYEDQFGVQAARYAHAILEQNKKAADLPCVAPTTYKLKINLKAAELQGLVLTEAQNTFLHHSFQTHIPFLLTNVKFRNSVCNCCNNDRDSAEGSPVGSSLSLYCDWSKA